MPGFASLASCHRQTHQNDQDIVFAAHGQTANVPKYLALAGVVDLWQHVDPPIHLIKVDGSCLLGGAVSRGTCFGKRGNGSYA